jgi:hypothetical protein
VFTALKQSILSTFPVSADAILILGGLGAYLASSLILRRPFLGFRALIPGFVISILIESSEILDQYGMLGFLSAGPGQLSAILLRHAKDVVIFNLAPVLVAVFARFNRG